MFVDTIAARVAKHPKLMSALLTVLLVLSQSGVVIAREATYPGP
ncbi:DUF7503 family protein [Halocatena salina]|nr:hypothetical protein [Halocatena salina]